MSKLHFWRYIVSTKLLKTLAGLIVSGGMLWLAFRGVQWHGFKTAIVGLKWHYLLFACLLSLLELLVAGWRWQVLLRPIRKFRINYCFYNFLIGTFLNHILPLRPGEIARVYLISKNGNIPKTSVLTSVLLEKLLDVLMLILLAWSLGIFVEWHDEYKIVGGMIMAVCFIGMIVSIWFVRQEKLIHKELPFSHYLPSKFIEQIQTKVIAVNSGLKSLQTRKSIFEVFLLTAILWGLGVLVTQMYIWAFGLQLPWYASSVVLVLISLGSFLPTSPGGVGVMHYLYIVSLTMFGVDKPTALAFGIVTHGLIYLINVSTGSYAVWRYRFGMHAWKEMYERENN